MSDERKISNYVLLGSFLGSLVGTTIVLLAMSGSKEEKKDRIKDLQRELLEPVKAKIGDFVDEIGQSFRNALHDVSSSSEEGNKRTLDDRDSY